MDWQETEQAKQDRLRLQKNLRIVTWICISIAFIAFIVALILYFTATDSVEPFPESLLFPMWIIGIIMFLTGVFWDRVKKLFVFGSGKQGPVSDQFERCACFMALCLFGSTGSPIGVPLYQSLVFVIFSALGFYLAFPTSERVANLVRQLREKEQNHPS